MEKKKFSFVGICLVIVGVLVIVFGFMFNTNKGNDSTTNPTPVGTYNYETDLEMGKVMYEFEIITSESIDTSSVYMIVSKTGVVETERIKLNFKSNPSGDEGYKFVVTLDSNKYFALSRNEISLEATNLSNQQISLTFDVFGKDSTEMINSVGGNMVNTFVKAVCIGVGAMLTITGLVLIIFRRKESTGSDVVDVALAGDTTSDEKSNDAENDNKQCSYCGSINKPDALKCRECGAPLGRGKKK